MFSLYLAGKVVEQTVDLLLIWDTLMFMWCHWNCIKSLHVLKDFDPSTICTLTIVLLLYWYTDMGSLSVIGKLHTTEYVSLHLQQWILRHECHHQNWMLSPVSKKYDGYMATEQSHKFHNAPVPYPTMHYSEQKCAYFCFEWYILRYGTGTFGGLWDWSTLWQRVSHCVSFWWINCCVFWKISKRIWAIVK